MNCPHCSGDHKAGHKDCRDMKLQMEVLAVQSNEGVSRHQARIILFRNNPSFQMIFSEALNKRTNNNPEPLTADKSPETTSKPSTSKQPPPDTAPSTSSLPKRVDIVCISPSGRNFVKNIINPLRPQSPFNPELDLTSENDPSIRGEARRLFDSFEEDLDSYQNELKRAPLPKTSWK